MALERVESQKHAAAGQDHLHGARREVQQHQEAAHHGKAPEQKNSENVGKPATKQPADGHLDMSANPYAKGDNAKNHDGFPGAEQAARPPAQSAQKPDSKIPAGKTSESTGANSPSGSKGESWDIQSNYSLRNPSSKQFGPNSLDSKQKQPPADLSSVPMS
jgi:hypothetical protein